MTSPAQLIPPLLKEIQPYGATLVAVSKTKPESLIMEAYQAGQRHFGENKVQEIQRKAPLLPSDIQWHMIGHLQSNKVRALLPYVFMIHGVDSLKLLLEIEKEAMRIQKTIRVLLQVHIAEEETKFGWDGDELKKAIQGGMLDTLKFAKVQGLMGMASNTEDSQQVRSEFKALHTLYTELKNGVQICANFDTLSMGMSGDYPIALEEGSNMIRVGSKLFGERTYPS